MAFMEHGNMLNIRSIKTQLILFLCCFAVFLFIRDKSIAFLLAMTLAVVSTVVMDLIIVYVRTKALRVTESAVITGLIIGYVLSSEEAWLKFVFSSCVAVFSRHFIFFQKRHIFNPAALGILASTILFGASTQWMGTYVWYMVVPFGLYLAYKIRRVEVVVGYVVVSCVLLGISAAVQQLPVFGIFGYVSYFYIFIMLVEPKTGPANMIGKYLFGGGAAALAFIFTEIGGRVDAELWALLIMNVMVPLLSKLQSRKRGV